jgi:hypothetical protein
MTQVDTNREPLELQDVSNYLSPQAAIGEEHLSNNSSDAPSHAVSALERWNQSKRNVFKTTSTFFGFIVMGANDAAYGCVSSHLCP